MLSYGGHLGSKRQWHEPSLAHQSPLRKPLGELADPLLLTDAYESVEATLEDLDLLLGPPIVGLELGEAW